MFIQDTKNENNIPNIFVNIACPTYRAQPNRTAQISGHAPRQPRHSNTITRGEKSGKRLTYVISQLPARGTLYQLSSVYSSHGYEPIQGTQITTKNTTITGSLNRVYYKQAHRRLHLCTFKTPTKWERGDADCAFEMRNGVRSERADSFSYTVQTTNNPQPSNEGTITIVNTDGTIVCSDFLLGTDDWTIVGNKARVSAPIFEPYSRNNFINHYIYATDNHVHVPTNNHVSTNSQRDKALWYFNAPSKMLGNLGIAYGGYISFTMSIFAGDMTQMNQGVNLVELECSRCGYNKGITLGYPMPANPIKNNMASFKIELTETANWQKITQDTTTTSQPSHNVRYERTYPSKCEFIQVLSQLSGLRILGDLTQWTETVALDNVYISNNKSYTSNLL